MKSVFITVCVVALCVSGVVGDLYMHNPRGSNDRNCERNENRNNGNRLFDSQNNDKGGYACPRAVGGPETVTPMMYYYAGSKLQVEWTNQHACGNNPNVECELVLQYMCAPEEAYEMDDPMYDITNAELRDGTPTTADDAATDRMEAGDVDNQRFGYHETYNFYRACETRDRNGGLWIADRQVNRRDATGTRQNNNGARRGWECPEERDYYPYWHPTPWKDIAVLTGQTGRCNMYKRESQNVQEKGWCKTATNTWASENSKPACEGEGHNWVVVPAWGIPAPACEQAPWSRDNHLGNGKGGHTNKYIWTLPTYMSETAEKCVFRMRYNISTGEVAWNLDHTYNGATSPIYQDPMVHITGWDRDPTDEWKETVNVSLAVNTNQYGRTFQDRSYVFTIKKRNDGSDVSGTIWNLNVRGKRGNIVQTYPSVEYDFVPTELEITKGDYVHFQWTGSDYNPDRQPNNGEGGPEDPANADTYRADRSNIVPVRRRTHVPRQDDAKIGQWFGALSREQMVALAYANQDVNDCLTLEELYIKNNNDEDEVDKDSQNCMKINAARTPYFDMDPVKLSKPGMYHYMSTRNNNFSNRSQRASIRVNDSLSQKERIAIGTGAAIGATMAVVGASVVWAKKNPNGQVAGFLGKTPLLN